MTQTVASISAAEEDRDCLASGLESKILVHRQLLEHISDRVGRSLEEQKDIKTCLQDQSSVLDDLGKMVDENCRQLNSQEDSIEKILTVANRTQTQTKSILTTTTEMLSFITSGLMHLRQMTEQLHSMVRVCATFTVEMRTAMSKLMELFFGLQTVLQRIESNLPARLHLPTVQFTTALGEMMALPYQLCQQWTTLRELLRVIFLDRPERFRIDMGKYFIVNDRSGEFLDESSWQHTVQQDDHLSMCIILDGLDARTGICSLPTCEASTESVEIVNGSRKCRKCDRWSLLTPRERGMLPDASNSKLLGAFELRRTIKPTNEDADPSSDFNISQLIENKEDIELYRQIHVQYSSTEKPIVKAMNRIVPRHFGTASYYSFVEGEYPESRS